jgi:hypothetical protein
MRPLRISLALAVPATIAAIVAAAPAASAAPAAVTAHVTDAATTTPAVNYMAVHTAASAQPPTPTTVTPSPAPGGTPAVAACPSGYGYLIDDSGGGYALAATGLGDDPVDTVTQPGNCWKPADCITVVPDSIFCKFQDGNWDNHCLSWNEKELEVVTVASCGDVDWNYWGFAGSSPSYHIESLYNGDYMAAYLLENGSYVEIKAWGGATKTNSWAYYSN